jgi:hypothetical protein
LKDRAKTSEGKLSANCRRKRKKPKWDYRNERQRVERRSQETVEQKEIRLQGQKQRHAVRRSQRILE